jgi:hypothetical protein
MTSKKKIRPTGVSAIKKVNLPGIQASGVFRRNFLVFFPSKNEKKHETELVKIL